MSGGLYQIKEVARFAKVTVRALHHYDKIGLLVPAARSPSGYRLYAKEDLLRLQQILIWRALGLSLSQIKKTLDDPQFDLEAALLEQRSLLQQRIEQAQTMIKAVDAARASIGDQEVFMNTPDSLFDGFKPEDYQEEVEQKWGQTEAYRESAQRTQKYTEDDWAKIKAENARIMERLVEKMNGGASPEDEEVLALVEQHRLHIDRWYYPCSPQMHAQLAGLYEADERFKLNLDKYGEGLAGFLSSAIRAAL